MRHIVDMLEFIIGQILFDYLGVPIFESKPRTHHLRIIAARVFSKLNNLNGITFLVIDGVIILHEH